MKNLTITQVDLEEGLIRMKMMRVVGINKHKMLNPLLLINMRLYRGTFLRYVFLDVYMN